MGKDHFLIKAITFDFWNTLYRTRIPANNERIDIIKTVLAGQGYYLDAGSLENAVKKAWNYWDIILFNERRTAIKEFGKERFLTGSSGDDIGIVSIRRQF